MYSPCSCIARSLTLCSRTDIYTDRILVRREYIRMEDEKIVVKKRFNREIDVELFGAYPPHHPITNWAALPNNFSQ